MPLVDKPTLCDASEPTPNFLKPSLTTAKQQLQGSYPVVKFHGVDCLGGLAANVVNECMY